MPRLVLVLLLSATVAGAVPGPPAPAAVHMPPPLPPLREQDRVRQEWLEARLGRVLPALMRRHGVAMWIVTSREYAEDPAFFSLVSPSVMAARRRTILVFHDRGKENGIERLTLGGGSNGGLYEVYRDPETSRRELMGQSQWDLLRRVIDERQPATIAVDISHTHAFSDGLSAGEREQLEAALGPWRSRLVRAEGLPLDYIAVRVPEMMPAYRHLMRLAHALIARAFSSEVITPGRTTTDDVVWWLRQQVRDLGMGEWFAPSVTVQRRGRRAPEDPVASRAGAGGTVIERGDHLHTDFGIYAMGLATDTQHVGYVLAAGETDAPAGLRKALQNSNRLQDLLLARLRPGRTGNEVFTDTVAAMKEAGIEGTVYTHPIGDHGHGAGPLIGLWDRQQAIPGRGDVVVLPSTWFSIELEATTPVPEWDGQPVKSAQEEDAAIDAEGRIAWVLSRQEEYHLIR
ncbi:MAG TPA: M24 family metallopeptidase [Vicinamibacteria bacterium]|nr:M24 family metallopeptidase [Vicinamibacteria bacterium]